MPFLEEYKRFRFSDIQAFAVAKTSRYGRGLFYLSVLLLSCIAITLISVISGNFGMGVVIGLSFFIFLALVSLSMLLRHLILGPTCVCDVQTVLTKERLRPLNRYFLTLEIMERVDRCIRERQAEIVAFGDGSGERSPGIRNLPGVAIQRYSIPGPVPWANVLFLSLGLFGLVALHLENVFLTGIVMFLLFAGSLLLTMTLISVVRKATPDSVRLLLWLLLGIHFMVVGVGAVYFLFAATNEPAYTVGLIGPLEAFTGIATDGAVWVYGLFAGLFLGFFLVGVAGLLESLKWKRQILLARGLELDREIEAKKRGTGDD